MDLKSILKSLKLNESNISMILGGIVIVVVGLLVVNYFKGIDTGKTLPAIETEDLSITLPATHQVAQGEDLWKISEKYYKTGYNWIDIATENNLKAPYTIEVGQTLNIPDVESKLLAKDEDTDVNIIEEQENPTAVIDIQDKSDDLDIKQLDKLTDTSTDNAIQEENEISSSTYTVVRGDNLWDISVKAYGDGYKWVEIAEANDLVNPGIIHAGNVFIIPR